MVEVSALHLLPAEEQGIEYLDKGAARFIPLRNCEIQQALDIFDHSGSQYHFFDIVLTKTAIGVLVLCDGNLGLATWMGSTYHCFCGTTKEELESAEIIGNIYEDPMVNEESEENLLINEKG